MYFISRTPETQKQKATFISKLPLGNTCGYEFRMAVLLITGLRCGNVLDKPSRKAAPWISC